MSDKPLACLSAHVHACLCCHVALMLCRGSIASQLMHLLTRVLQLPMSHHYSIVVARAMSSSAAHVPHTLLRSSLHQYETKYAQQLHNFHMDREQRATSLRRPANASLDANHAEPLSFCTKTVELRRSLMFGHVFLSPSTVSTSQTILLQPAARSARPCSARPLAR